MASLHLEKNAKESYERMINIVNTAEKELNLKSKKRQN